MPPKKPNPFTHPLFTFMLLMAASTPDPAEKLNNMGKAVNSMREALNSINAGLEAFHTQVVPMFMQQPGKK